MALKFDGVADRAIAPVNLGGMAEACVSFWLWWDAFANDDDIALEYTTNSNTNAGFYFDPNSASGNLVVTWTNGSGNTRVQNYTRFTAAQWTHFFLRVNYANTTCDLWINGVFTAPNSSTGTAPGTGTRFASSQFYLMHRGTNTLFGAGRMAELSIWSGTSNTQYPDAQSLYRGASPLRTHPRNLLAYYPMRDGDTRSYARAGANEIQRIVGVDVAPSDMPSNLPFVGQIAVFVASDISPGTAYVETDTALVDLQLSSAEVTTLTDADTIYIDVQPSGTDGRTLIDTDTVLVDFTISHCEWYIAQPAPEFMYSEYNVWSQEAGQKWVATAQPKWQYTANVVTRVPEEICV